MPTFTYKGITIEKFRGRYMIVSNKDLLKLGLVTHKTLQKGHQGYLSLERLKKVIDKKI